MRKIDIIQRAFSNNTKEYSIVWGLDADLTFYVYSIPDFVRIYTGPDENEARRIFNEYTKTFNGETESYL